MDTVYPLTLYYDSSCPLCNQEMTRLKQHDQADNLKLVDCSAADYAARLTLAAWVSSWQWLS